MVQGYGDGLQDTAPDGGRRLQRWSPVTRICTYERSFISILLETHFYTAQLADPLEVHSINCPKIFDQKKYLSSLKLVASKASNLIGSMVQNSFQMVLKTGCFTLYNSQYTKKAALSLCRTHDEEWSRAQCMDIMDTWYEV